MRTTRPTSTSLQDDALISASPIVIYSGEQSSVQRPGVVSELWKRTGRCCRGFVGLLVKSRCLDFGKFSASFTERISL